VEVGRQNWDQAVKHLRELKRHLGSEEEWIAYAHEGLGQPLVVNASTPNLRGGQIGSRGAGPNISQDTEGGKWLTVVSSGNPAIVHHVPIGIALEKGTKAGRLRGPTMGPGGVVYEYTGKTKMGKGGKRPSYGG
jgi:hypothetical protein